MAVYSKICIICQKKFYAMKVNKMFCSKTCSNRTRYLPKELVASLVQRNSQYTIKANKYVAMVQDDFGNESAHGYEPPETSNEHPLGKDEGYLYALAKMKKEQRDRESELQQEKQEKQEIAPIDSGFGQESEDGVSVDDKHEVFDLTDLLDKPQQKYKIHGFSRKED
jgi:hypothetical protein